MPEGYAIQAIQAVLSGQRAYCKFLAANDTGLTGYQGDEQGKMGKGQMAGRY